MTGTTGAHATNTYAILSSSIWKVRVALGGICARCTGANTPAQARVTDARLE